MSEKQDRTYTRTASDLERKYKFGSSFAEVMGIATGARDAASEANASIDKLDNKLDSTEIFNRLTENGTLQGLYKEDGDLYINAKYIGNVEELFAQNITMSGKFTTTAEVFFEPGEQELETIRAIIVGSDVTTDKTLYDFNDDGVVDVIDLAKLRMAMQGQTSLASWSGAKKSNAIITIDISNPTKAVRITGTNMWGRSVDNYFGANSPFMNSDAYKTFESFLEESEAYTNLKTIVDAIDSTYLKLAGGTLQGSLRIDASSNNRDLGVKFTSLQSGDTGALYLFGHQTVGRGLYDSIKGMVISVTDSGATFNGSATGWSSFFEGSGYMGFANNHKICWGSFSTGTYNASTAAGYNYYGDVTVSVTFPSAFNGTPTLLLQPTGGTAYVVAVEPVTWSSTGITKIRVHRANSATNVAAATIRYIAIY